MPRPKKTPTSETPPPEKPRPPAQEAETALVVLTPWTIFQAALKAVPALKFALAVLGLVSVLVIVKGFGIDFNIAVFGTIILLVLMVALVVFAALTGVKSPQVRLAALVMMWSFLTLTILTAALLFMSAFFDIPRPLDKLLQRGASGTQSRPALGWKVGPGKYHHLPEFAGISEVPDKEMKLCPRFTSLADFHEVQERQKENKWNRSDPCYYTFYTRELQEYESLPERIGLRPDIRALLVVYVQKFDHAWVTGGQFQGWVTPENPFVAISKESKTGRSHMIFLVIFPFDVTGFRDALDINKSNIEALLAIS